MTAGVMAGLVVGNTRLCAVTSLQKYLVAVRKVVAKWSLVRFSDRSYFDLSH